MRESFSAAFCGVCVVLFGTAFAAADHPQKGPLAQLPSKPGPHIEKIISLPDNSWLNLGAPAPDPTWGKARGRSWSCKMPLAPELRGAFLFREGVHGYSKPDGRYMDDLWFYDLNGHRWVCCYPGADGKTLDLKLNDSGFESTKDGEPLPVASMVHAYEMATYDSDARRFMNMPCPGDYWRKALGERRKEWTKEPYKFLNASPWMYDVDTGKWDRKAAKISPRSGFGDVLLYVPSLKQAFFRNNESVWFYDPAANLWTDVKPTGPNPPFGIEPTVCLDSKRDRIYIGGGAYPVTPKGINAFRIFDLKTKTWIDPLPKGAPCGGSNRYTTDIAAMAYDTVNDVVVLFRYRTIQGGSKTELGVFIYDPVANAWTEEPVSDVKATGFVNAFYDPQLNVHVLHGAGDSSDNGSIWIYRYKRGNK